MLKRRMIFLLAALALSGCAEDKPSYEPPEKSEACKAFQREADSMQEPGKTMSRDEWNAWVDDLSERMKKELPQDEICLIRGNGARF